jgi:hypothetical protein
LATAGTLGTAPEVTRWQRWRAGIKSFIVDVISAEKPISVHAKVLELGVDGYLI